MEYERLARRHRDAIYRQMVRVCGNYDDAEDVLVEALLAAYRALPQLKSEEAFPAWLSTIGRRVCARIQRQEALQPILSLSGLPDGELEPKDVRTSVDTDVENSSLADVVKVLVKNLPASLREVYRLRELEGLSAEETAGKLHLSVSAVKSRLHRARTLIRASLDESMKAS